MSQIIHIDAHIDDPDIRVRVHPQGKLCAPFVTLSIDQIAFFIDPGYDDIEDQLDKVEAIGKRILDAVATARPSPEGVAA